MEKKKTIYSTFAAAFEMLRFLKGFESRYPDDNFENSEDLKLIKKVRRVLEDSQEKINQLITEFQKELSERNSVQNLYNTLLRHYTEVTSPSKVNRGPNEPSFEFMMKLYFEEEAQEAIEFFDIPKEHISAADYGGPRDAAKRRIAEYFKEKKIKGYSLNSLRGKTKPLNLAPWISYAMDNPTVESLANFADLVFQDLDKKEFIKFLTLNKDKFTKTN